MLSNGVQLTNLDFEQEQAAPHPQWVETEQLPLFIQVKQALDQYFAGKLTEFSHLPLAPQGTLFQQQVWHALLQIPYGASTSYSHLAQQINNPKAIRAIGGAVGRNPISIIIPCHRVLGKNGALTGFGGGLAVKRHLLQLEQIQYKDQGTEVVKPKQLKKYQL